MTNLLSDQFASISDVLALLFAEHHPREEAAIPSPLAPSPPSNSSNASSASTLSTNCQFVTSLALIATCSVSAFYPFAISAILASSPAMKDPSEAPVSTAPQASKCDRVFGVANALFGLLLAVAAGGAFAYYMWALHETRLWFSNISEVEREISMRTESGLYYFYYKQFVAAPDLRIAFRQLIYDEDTEYPRVINVLERFNVYQEVLLALIYRLFLSPAVIDSMLFYVYSCFAITGLGVTAIFLLAWKVGGSWTCGLLAASWMFANLDDATRAFFTVNLREVFALPMFWLQNVLTVEILTTEKQLTSTWLLHVLLTFAFAIFWQFNQFILIFQSLAVFGCALLNPKKAAAVKWALTAQTGGFLLVIAAQFGQLMLISSLSLWLNVSILFVLTFMNLNESSGVGARLFRADVAAVLTVGCSMLVKQLLQVDADTHIWTFVKAKLGFITEDISFETNLYLCHGSFGFIDPGFFSRTSLTGALPLFVAVVVIVAGRVALSLWRGTQMVAVEVVYVTVQSALCGIMALFALRMKFVWFPQLCVVAAVGLYRFASRLLNCSAGAVILLALSAHLLNMQVKTYQEQMANEQEFYDPDTVALMEWIKTSTRPTATFTGSMQLLAGVKCCTGRRLTNHPHFEDRWLRERTQRLYQIYGRTPVADVHRMLKKEVSNYIILEDSICLASSTGCSTNDLIDMANGHLTDSGKGAFLPGSLKPTAEERFCNRIRDVESPDMWSRSVAVVLLLVSAVFGNSVRRIMTVEDNLEKFTIHMNGYSPNMHDDYVAVAMEAKAGYIVKFEPFAHADRVHHMLLYGCEQPAGNTYFWKGMQTCSGAAHILYAWARNAPALTLPNDVAFAVGNEGDSIRYLVLQIHYAQPFAGNVKDYSGVTLHMSQQKPANLAAVLLFVSGNPIPPGLNQFQSNMSCIYNGGPDLHPFAFRTHTHGMGRVVSAFYKHDDKWIPIGKRNPQWPQLFQPIATSPVIRQGDLMAAQCRFDSHDKKNPVRMGSMGMDEMCNFYMMYYWDASKPHPFPSGGYCGDQQYGQMVANEYPVDGVTLLPSHPEWEHQAHQSAKAFGVVEKMRVSQIDQHKLGQVAGLSFDKNGNVVVFHRADKVWNQFTFDDNNMLTDRAPISRSTILVAKPGEKGLTLVAEYGSSMFYLPHGIFVDGSDNYYTTDVGSHQVKKLKIQNGKLVEVFSLGTKFQPGAGKDHFCKPAGITVSKRDGSIFVADGYCNNRVVRFSKDGKYMSEFGQAATRENRFALGAFSLPHDVVIDDDNGQLYVTDRINGRVQKFMVDGAPLGDFRDINMISNVYSADYNSEPSLFRRPDPSPNPGNLDGCSF
uniref:Peptidylglycine monooxygenase n=1 Tax=Steinernema glaseri TaxID=37863 RepID=A0A1I8AP06_9BILA